MKCLKSTWACWGAVAICLLLGRPLVCDDSKLNLDDLVAKHLESIGTAEARSAVKSRVAQGNVAFNERITGSVHLDGAAVVASSGPKFKCTFQFNNPQYPGEQFVFTGQSVHVSQIDPQSRSALGNFLVNESEIIQEGLFGGVLATNWPLLDVKTSGAKLKSDGLRKIEGRELYEVTYVPKKRSGTGDLVIHLYFEPQSFRHVMTIYWLSATAVDPQQSQASDAGTRLTKVTELFSDFHSVDGVTLPTQWEIRFRVEPGRAQEFEWKVGISSVVHNRL
jgi:hypothetical protein